MTRVLVVGTSLDLCEAHMFAGLARRGIQIDMLMDSARNHAEVVESAGIEFSTIRFRGRIDPVSIRSLRQRFKKNGYDIVHCLSNRALSNTILAGWKIPFKLVAYRGTMGHLSRLDPLSWLTYLHPRVDMVSCVSDAVREYLSAFLPGDKLVRIYKGHEETWYSSDPPAPLRDFGVPEGAFVVACVANMRPVKGVPYLIEALKFIPAEKNVHLLLIGKVQDNEVRELLKRASYAERVHCAGFQRMVTGLVAKCDALVMASTKREGLGKAVIEAMIMEVPTIVTSVGGLPEIVVDGECGIVVPPRNARAIADAISFLHDNRQTAVEYGKRGRLRIREHFNVTDTIEATSNVYSRLLS